MAALEYGEIAKDDVSAVLERDRFVADASLFGLVHGIVPAIARERRRCRCGGACRRSGVAGSIASLDGSSRSKAFTRRSNAGGAGSEAQSFAVDQAGATDADVVERLAPDERVVPVIVPVVLVRFPFAVGLGCIVGSPVIASGLAGQRRVGRQNRAALREIQMHMAPKMNRKAKVGSGGEVDGPSSSTHRSLNCLIDSRGVERLSVSFGPIVANVEDQRRRIG